MNKDLPTYSAGYVEDLRTELQNLKTSDPYNMDTDAARYHEEHGAAKLAHHFGYGCWDLALEHEWHDWHHHSKQVVALLRTLRKS
jgi:hypothetical protein